MTEASRSREGAESLAGEVNIYQKPTYTVVKIVLHNPGETPVTVQLGQSLPSELSESHVTFPSKYHGEDWTFSPGQLEFETDIGPSSTLRTAYGTKGINLSDLKERIQEATVSVYEGGDEIGRLTGLQPAVVETAGDTSDHSTSKSGQEDTSSDERTAREIFGDDAVDETAEDDGETTHHEGESEAEQSMSRTDGTLTAESIVDSGDEPQKSEDKGVSTIATEESPDEGDTGGTDKTADETETAVDDAEVAFETPDGEPWVTITETGSDDTTESGGESSEEERTGDPEMGDETAGETTTRTDVDGETTTEESAVQWQSEPSGQGQATGGESAQSTPAEMATEPGHETNSGRTPAAETTTDLPANRSDYILEEVRGHIKSSEEFEWVPLGGEEPEEAEPTGILGRIRSWFSR